LLRLVCQLNAERSDLIIALRQFLSSSRQVLHSVPAHVEITDSDNAKVTNSPVVSAMTLVIESKASTEIVTVVDSVLIVLVLDLGNLAIIVLRLYVVVRNVQTFVVTQCISFGGV
jgi:hypothetical protein